MPVHARRKGRQNACRLRVSRFKVHFRAGRGRVGNRDPESRAAVSLIQSRISARLDPGAAFLAKSGARPGRSASAIILEPMGLRELRKEKERSDRRRPSTTSRSSAPGSGWPSRMPCATSRSPTSMRFSGSLKLKGFSSTVLGFRSSRPAFAQPIRQSRLRGSGSGRHPGGEFLRRACRSASRERETLPTWSASFPCADDDGTNLGSMAVVRPAGCAASRLRVRDDLDRPFHLDPIAGVAGVGWFLVHLYVGRPLMRLMMAMEDVRAGNLTANVFRRNGPTGGPSDTPNQFHGARAWRAPSVASDRYQPNRGGAGGGPASAGNRLATLGQPLGRLHEIGSPLQILNGRARALASPGADLPPEIRRVAQVSRSNR